MLNNIKGFNKENINIHKFLEKEKSCNLIKISLQLYFQRINEVQKIMLNIITNNFT